MKLSKKITQLQGDKENVSPHPRAPSKKQAIDDRKNSNESSRQQLQKELLTEKEAERERALQWIARGIREQKIQELQLLGASRKMCLEALSAQDDDLKRATWWILDKMREAGSELDKRIYNPAKSQLSFRDANMMENLKVIWKTPQNERDGTCNSTADTKIGTSQHNEKSLSAVPGDEEEFGTLMNQLLPENRIWQPTNFSRQQHAAVSISPGSSDARAVPTTPPKESNSPVRFYNPFGTSPNITLRSVCSPNK